MRQTFILGCLAYATAAWAGPAKADKIDKMHSHQATGPADDEAAPERAVGINEEPIKILDSSRAGTCSARAGICFTPGARTTIAVESPPVVSAKPSSATPPQFRRAAAIAATGETPHAETSQAWTIDMAAQLKRAGVAGNALFLFYDSADPNAIKDQQTSALLQASIKAGKALAVHFSLSPEDGFRAGHSYRLRVVQLLGGKEVILGEADLTLL